MWHKSLYSSCIACPRCGACRWLSLRLNQGHHYLPSDVQKRGYGSYRARSRFTGTAGRRSYGRDVGADAGGAADGGCD
jgi:hypothetical protein